ncbi:glycoside hydrolase superfamily [Amylocystis lapponica]|nr:glycoside hydrolase superfamily [Amylocystis lapponica]
MLSFVLASFIVLATPIASQQIFDIWETSWDRTSQLKYTDLGNSPINFVSPGAIGDADIVINDGTVLQQMIGFGSTLTDSSAQLLSKLKSQNSGNYWSILNYAFDVTDGANAAGLAYLRVPIGASDFSANAYSFDDVSGDTSLNSFNINNAPSYLFDVLKDIVGINKNIYVHIVPWSPPAWMKDSGSLLGGSFLSQYTDNYANYLLKSVQGFKSQGIPIWAVGLQNEPENNNPTYPTCAISASQEAAIGKSLRPLLDNNGLSSVNIIAFEHNWSDAGAYPVDVMQSAASAFSGASFHCYEGSVSDQKQFATAFPDKAIYFHECTGEYGSDYWSDIKWYMDNIFSGSVNQGSSNAAMWNFALDGNGEPKLPGTNSCGTPCRPLVTINSDGSFSYNQEFLSAGQIAKATIPKDAGGPSAQRISSSVGGSKDWGLVVSAFVTRRSSSSDWNRYSIVVLNWDDSPNGSWDPTPIKTTIEFRGKQATYTFPVGVTTLWWYAAQQ